MQSISHRNLPNKTNGRRIKDIFLIRKESGVETKSNQSNGKQIINTK